MNNADLVYLNVGGTKFETKQGTLAFSPYFQGIIHLNGSIKSSPDFPYFIDQDPKIFRHVLNLLRNPDYDYPIKYLNELEFYGFNITEIRESIHKTSLIPKLDPEFILPAHQFDVNSLDASSVSSSQRVVPFEANYIYENPVITFFKHIYRRHTYHEPLQYQTFLFDGKTSWMYHIKGDFVLINTYLLIPKYFSDKLKYFSITVMFGSDKFSFRLDVLNYLQHIAIVDNFLLIDIGEIYTRHQCIYIFETHDDNKTISIGLDCSYNIDKIGTFETMLKLKTVNLTSDKSKEEYAKFYQNTGESIYSKMDTYTITKDGFLLPIGEIICIVFNTDYDYVVIEYINDDGTIDTNRSFTISKFDARYLYAIGNVEIDTRSYSYTNDLGGGYISRPNKSFYGQELPENWGILSFNLAGSMFNNQPSGFLESDGKCWIRFVSKNKNIDERDGTIWIYQYCVVKYSSYTKYQIAKETSYVSLYDTPHIPNIEF